MPTQTLLWAESNRGMSVVSAAVLPRSRRFELRPGVTGLYLYRHANHIKKQYKHGFSFEKCFQRGLKLSLKGKSVVNEATDFCTFSLTSTTQL
jgi:hypothetical protein